MAQPQIVRFYDPNINAPFDPSRPDTTLNHILEHWTDARLERDHDYIQHLFPVPERSMFNPHAPVVDEEVYLIFNDNDRRDLRDRLKLSLDRMYRFYGLDPEGNVSADDAEACIGIEALKLPNFDQRAYRTWFMRNNHNHLRITRIIRCLRLLGLQDQAERFCHTVISINKCHVNADGTVGGPVASDLYWLRAVDEPLFRSPDPAVTTEIEWLHQYDPTPESSPRSSPRDSGQDNNPTEDIGLDPGSESGSDSMADPMSDG